MREYLNLNSTLYSSAPNIRPHPLVLPSQSIECSMAPPVACFNIIMREDFNCKYDLIPNILSPSPVLLRINFHDISPFGNTLKKNYNILVIEQCNSKLPGKIRNKLELPWIDLERLPLIAHFLWECPKAISKYYASHRPSRNKTKTRTRILLPTIHSAIIL